MARHLLTLLAFGLALSGAARAEDVPAPAPARGGPPPVLEARPTILEVTPESKVAIQRGLAYLAATQAHAGNWHGGEYNIAVTALCGLSLLAGGSTPASGPYAENIRRAVDYLVSRQGMSGLFQEGNDSRPMYGHGFTLLFLSECYGQCGEFTPDRSLKDAIKKAVRLTSSCQTEDGGWYYTATRDEDEGSVTISQIQGLRAARNAGFKVDRAVIDRAIDYIRRSQEPEGGVRYTARYGRSSLALTGAGLAVLFGAGDYDSKNVARALAYVRAHMETGPETPHFNYTHFYLAQALHQQGGPAWDDYFPRIRAELLRTQSSRGSWPSTYGAAYATALSLLVLEIPYRYLPIYER
ncbi:MAG TPA: prenyltransferase/squalene oxidase repeat-containing protein [Planctomycetota bacterium]|nr:prenyltransferase/squalene oxidase repeat-containing protein [Planctomycetota bacterium]